MNKENLQKSIALIGPSGVGKSLITNELSKRTNLPVISLDDLKFYSCLEKLKYVSQNKNDTNLFVKKLFNDIQKENPIDLSDKNLVLARKNQIAETIKTYFKLTDMLNCNLSFIDKYIDKYLDNIELYFGGDIKKNFNSRIALAENILISNEELNFILNRINLPIILDLPAFYGWKIPTRFFNAGDKELIKKAKIDINTTQINKNVSSVLNSLGTVAMLEPSVDYKQRTKFDKSSNTNQNAIVLENVTNYYYNADIVLSSNSLFYETDPKILSDRKWFSTKNDIEKERVKNKSEISNICEQILGYQKDKNQMQ